ncbi:MAG: hypothetical protein Q8J89_10200 [Caulobacter sp.]|nr:hypothetical protein [Caulobacter sp.]
MKRLAALAAVCLMVAACTTTNVKSAAGLPDAPPQKARILLIEPDVRLSVILASGLQEPRADWSASARANLQAAVEQSLRTRSHAYTLFKPEENMDGRAGQLLRLNAAVGQAIMLHSYGPFPLPAKGKAFDWTLGEGATALGGAAEADYALFIHGAGSYSSGGRVAVMVGAALLGVSLPTGGQQVHASLVDLKTGRVVWFNVAMAAPGADMREPEGAGLLVESMLKDAPL